MLSVKKATKFAVANLIIVSTVFSSVTPAIAQSDKSSKDESFAVGNTKNPKNVIFLVGVIPHVHELLTPLVSVVALQLISYYAALHRDLDVDKPRNLAKSVTVE